MTVQSIVVENVSDSQQQLAALGIVLQPGGSVDLLTKMALAQVPQYKELQDLLDDGFVNVTVTTDQGVSRFDSGSFDFVDNIQTQVINLQSSRYTPVSASMQVIASQNLDPVLDIGKLLKINSLNQADVYSLTAGVASDYYLGKLLSIQGIMAIIENVPVATLIASETIAKGAQVSGSDGGTVRTVRGADIVLGTAMSRAIRVNQLIWVRFT